MNTIKAAFAGKTLILPARMNSYTSSPRLTYMNLGLSPQELHSTCFVSRQSQSDMVVKPPQRDTSPTFLSLAGQTANR
jgi:hypothetical protein